MVVNGCGAAAIAVTKFLMFLGVKHITMVERFGIVCEGDERLNPAQQEMAKVTNREHMTGTLADAVKGADVFFGMSAPQVLTAEMVSTMAKDPMVFAMANPVPEIWPEDAKRRRCRCRHRPFGLSEPDQQRACVPGYFPWRT